jgi:hypothetical protein
MNPIFYVLVGALLVLLPAGMLFVVLWNELTAAQERLLNAKLAGADVPTRHDDSLAAVPIEPLPPRLQAIVMSWESDAAQQAAESQLRKWMSEGWTVDRLVEHYNPNGGEDE